MELYFVRHGQSANNAIWASHGTYNGRSSDPELTKIGYRQAAAVASFLSQPYVNDNVVGRDPQNLTGFGITHVYCSLMIRAIETGTAIADQLRLPLQAWFDVHELGGIFLDGAQPGIRNGLPGNDRAYLEQRFPHLRLPDTIGAGGWWNRPYEMEDECSVRAHRFLADLRVKHGDTQDRVVVVSHGDFYNMVLDALLSLPINSHHWFALNNAAVSRFVFSDDLLVISYLNRVDFLPRELIT